MTTPEKVLATFLVLALWGSACFALAARRADREDATQSWWGSE